MSSLSNNKPRKDFKQRANPFTLPQKSILNNCNLSLEIHTEISYTVKCRSGNNSTVK